MSIFNTGDYVGGYKVQSLIKQNEYTETYKTVNANEQPYFLKVYIMKRTPAKLVNNDSHEVLEIALLQKIQHVNVVSHIAHGSFDTIVGECKYLVTNYFTGEVLADKIAREGRIEPEKAVSIFMGILEGLKSLHDAGICHNDITPSNIMLSDTMDGAPEIIDLGHASQACEGTMPFDNTDLDIRYCANGNSASVYNERTDLFSATAVFYTMLTGHAPWTIDFAESDSFVTKMNKMKRYRKENPVEILSLPINDTLKYILEKGLSLSTSECYRSANDLLRDLNGQGGSKKPGKISEHAQEEAKASGKSQESENELKIPTQKGTGHGFDDIAGMHELKELLQQKVIFVIQNKELSEQYRLTPPNGMLLYGPPGCGKSFFAEKFAEQTQFNFILVKSSDLASIYVHGSQEKIGQLFKQAEKDAPTVLCFDEFDAFVPNRSSAGSEHVSGEVNEFLSQLNNCSKRGIFVVATTNRPDMIDPAVLRTGRLDKHIYVPLPDHDARKEMFAIHMKGRPFEENSIDFDHLSDLTDGYIASDIAYIVNDAAMTAAFTRSMITQELLERAISETKPSISKDTLKMYDTIREKMDGIERSNLLPRIGFRKDE